MIRRYVNSREFSNSFNEDDRGKGAEGRKQLENGDFLCESLFQTVSYCKLGYLDREEGKARTRDGTDHKANSRQSAVRCLDLERGATRKERG
ncbi:hypothetical protein HZH68_006462 [Vespula germanica]|uniref:Uncharacterized protein n=1 Tax=Vespula germanica TaxID=30212 RepID=A0A834NDQ1_VESGE|nr:hypothetical protein HZH68_006462 [Vespula germanica]